uniref:RNA-directed RNA polymerase n=1 Tax=Crocidura shantungensis seadorna-like virus 3 TaxID=3139547 RepID=A0AB38ZK59_9REOV
MEVDSCGEAAASFESKLSLIFEKGQDGLMEKIHVPIRSEVFYDKYKKDVLGSLKKLRPQDLLEKFLPLGYIDRQLYEKSEKKDIIYVENGVEYKYLSYKQILDRRIAKEDVARLVIPIDMIMVIPGIEITLGMTLFSYICRDFEIKLLDKEHGIFSYSSDEVVGSAQWIIFLLQCAIQEVSFMNEGIDIVPFHEFVWKVIPSPRKINNILRTPISYFVKIFGIGASRQFICKYEENPEELNDKKYTYIGSEFIQNPFVSEIKSSGFEEILEEHAKCGLSFIRSEAIYESLDYGKIRYLSSLLSYQGLVGYGRSLVSIEDDRMTEDTEIKCLNRSFQDEEKKAYLIDFANTYRKYWVTILEQAKEKGLLSPDKEALPFVLKSYAKNTAAGQKARVKIGKKDYTLRKKSSIFYFGAKEPSVPPYSLGMRSVPVGADRTVYSIPFDIVEKQVAMLGLINRFIVGGGQGTKPTDPFTPGKLIVGDLEATGCRVIDHGDVIRNSSKTYKTLCLDYSDFDRSLGANLFRGIYLNALMQFFSRQDVQEAFGVLVGSEWKPKDQFVEFSDGLYERISPIYKVTHLSGELSTLLANSVYNAEVGS